MKTQVPHTRTSPNKAATSDRTPTSNRNSSTKRLPLPSCPGPKLEPFRGTASANIEFIEWIGNDDDVHSKVWKVRIDGTVYALKIFPFQKWESLKKCQGTLIMPPERDPLKRPPPAPQDYVDYLDPFNCECRAYGRLKQERCEDLAIRAHGYILLSKDQERRVTEAMGQEFVDWEKFPKTLNGHGLFERWEPHRHEPLRAIVKDYVTSSTPWMPSQVSQMYDDLEKLHELGIVVRDFHPGNYLGGKLVDFSLAWTTPHICIDRANKYGVRKIRLAEAEEFENMIIDHAQNARWKPADKQWPEKLSRWQSEEGEDFGYDIRLYDWQKWEETQ
ncbi:kinetochore Sim4 complex subunit FTA2-domain-containing protein [Diaporthe sp. PMI_573]|nr:kinetochore Sim4 complex subunit FTA2-domain-containing protein [Diaporthaceae sp. PMI_573]